MSSNDLPIWVNVLECSGLTVKGNGKVFVEVQFGSEIGMTKPVQANAGRAEWGFLLTLNEKKQPPPDELIFTVWGEDTASNRFMGVLKIGRNALFNVLANGKVHEGRYPLKKRSVRSNVTGDISLRLQNSAVCDFPRPPPVPVVKTDSASKLATLMVPDLPENTAPRTAPQGLKPAASPAVSQTTAPQTSSVRVAGDRAPTQPQKPAPTPSISEEGQGVKRGNALPNVMTLHVLGARDLLAKDNNGLSDPFVEIVFAKNKLHRTKVVSENLNPVWDEMFQLEIPSLKDPVLITVWDFDEGDEENDFLGQLELHPTDFSNEVPSEKWYPLLPRSARSSVTGELHVRVHLHWMGPDSELQGPAPETVELGILSGEAAQEGFVEAGAPGSISFEVVEAKGLLGKDDTGLSDPFCVVSSGIERYTTPTKQQTLKPVWNSVFHLMASETLTESIVVNVWDEDVGKHNDFLGKCVCPMKTFADGKLHDWWAPLRSRSRRTAVKGEIHLRARYFAPEDEVVVEGVTEQAQPSVSQPELESVPEIPVPSVVPSTPVRTPAREPRTWDISRPNLLLVEVVKAKELLAKDDNGLSDPFVVLTFGKQEHTTAIVPASLNPEWNEVFEFNVTSSKEVLKLVFWDDDPGKTNDFLGQLELKAVTFVDRQLHEGWHRLQKRGFRSKAAGEVFLRIQYTGNGTPAPTLSPLPAEVTSSPSRVADIVNQSALPPTDRLISIEVVQATNLLQPTKSTLPSPYVSLSFRSETKKTECVNRSVNPEWCEVFHFEVQSYEDVIELSIWDKVQSLFLGMTQLCVRDVRSQRHHDKWLPLQRQNSRAPPVQGELRLRVTYPGVPPHERTPVRVTRGPVNTLSRRDSGSYGSLELEQQRVSGRPSKWSLSPVLLITLGEGRRLAASDESSKVFVELVLGRQKVLSSVATAFDTVAWNEPYQLDILNKEDELSVSVWEHKLDGQHIFLGQLFFQANELKAGVPMSWFTLQKRSILSTVSGELQLAIDPLPPSSMEELVHSLTEYEVELQELNAQIQAQRQLAEQAELELQAALEVQNNLSQQVRAAVNDKNRIKYSLQQTLEELRVYTHTTDDLMESGKIVEEDPVILRGFLLMQEKGKSRWMRVFAVLKGQELSYRCISDYCTKTGEELMADWGKDISGSFFVPICQIYDDTPPKPLYKPLIPIEPQLRLVCDDGRECILKQEVEAQEDGHVHENLNTWLREISLVRQHYHAQICSIP